MPFQKKYVFLQSKILTKKKDLAPVQNSNDMTIELPDIEHNQCIDHNLFIRLSHKDKALMDFLGVTKIPIQQELFGENKIPARAIILDDGHML